MTWGWLRRWGEAWLLAVGALALEAVAVVAVARAEIAGGYEVSLAMKTLLPLGALLALPVAVVGALASASVEHGDRREGRAGLAAVAAGWLGAVAYASSTGRLLAGARRPAFVLLALVAGAVAGWLLAPRLRRAADGLARRHPALVVVAVVPGLLGVELVNALVLRRLYPGFHVGLAVLFVALAPLVGLGFRFGHDDARWSSRGFVAGLTAALVLAVAGGVTAPRRLRLQDNLRWVFLEHAPSLAYAVELAAWLEPPPPIEDAIESEPRQGGERHVDLGHRDVLVVSIDALRADHVGAYGYSRPTTPRLDTLAREGAVFEAAYTATPHTSYAVASFMTGKYMRPLLLQGLGADSETLAQALRRYEFKTAAFYPPAVFFVDRDRFASFEESGLGFEYRKEQFASAAERADQLRAYLAGRPKDDRLFVWVHLFEPHEPYVAHPEHAFGERAIDRYDSEIAAADAGLGELIDVMRAARPDALVIVTADHGEEFGEHGGRYHGTSVYDEQVRVPLVMHAPGLVAPGRVRAPVGLVDLMPTILAAAGIPVSPRVRGRDLGPWLVGRGGEGTAFSETDDMTMLARGDLRLVCARRVGACRLHDLTTDPREERDVTATHPTEASGMKQEQRKLVASLGRFETGSDTSWPYALRRGIAGDADAGVDVATLLADADVRIRRKAAETLFELAHVEAPPGAKPSPPRLGEEIADSLRRALGRDEDETVRRWAALGLTRLGQGAPLTFDLAASSELDWQRLAALALAEVGDGRGTPTLLAWWGAAFPPVFPAPTSPPEVLPFERAKQLAAAFARLRSEEAVEPLVRALPDVRLRRHVAQALGALGRDAARPALVAALDVEPYHDARSVLARAAVALGGKAELIAPFVHYLGVPDPMPDALELAGTAELLLWLGGPNEHELPRLRRFATSGVVVGVMLPEGGNGRGTRIVVRARTRDGEPGEVRVGAMEGRRAAEDVTRDVPRAVPKLEPERSVRLPVRAGGQFSEVFETMPATVALTQWDMVDLVVYATQNVEVESLALVPLADEGPVKRPKPKERGK